MASVCMLKEMSDTYMGESECIKVYNKLAETFDDLLGLYMHRVIQTNPNEGNPLECFL